MNIISISLGVIGSILVLCQWFVFQSIRRHLFEKIQGVQRRIAYPVLVAFGLVTVLAARLEFGSEIFPPGTFGRQLVCVVVFSYLGWSLLLSLFFAVVEAIGCLVKFKGRVLRRRLTRPKSEDASKSHGRCLPSLCIGGEKEQKPNPGRNEEQFIQESGAERAFRFEYWNPTRRSFLMAASASGVMAATGLGIQGLAEAYSRPVVRRYEFFHHLLQDVAKPVTLIHFTDCHFGMFIGCRELRHLVEQVNALEGDALCITGDVFHSARTVPEQATPLLRELKPRRLGNFAVLGNHDLYAGEIRSVQNLKAAGLTLLRNQWISFRLGNSMIHFGGVDDPKINWLPTDEFPGFDKCMGEAPEEPGIRILLSHRPGVFPHAAKQKIDLVLAGHLHGGQIVVPAPWSERGISVATIVSEYSFGWYEIGSSLMHLSPGAGLSFLPWRIGCPPEIAMIKLNPVREY